MIGLAIGLAIQENQANLKILVLEKEADVCQHASGRNSGVIHAGFYYSSESLKARFCRLGNLELKKFCREQSLPLREIGKVVIAKSSADLTLLEGLQLRAQANSVETQLLNAAVLPNYEPMAKTFEKFLWSPTTAIASPPAVAQAMKDLFLRRGGKLLTGEEVLKISEDVTFLKGGGTVKFKVCVNSAGASALELAQANGVGKEFGLLPVVGGYISTPWNLIPLKTLVYSAPHPLSPFLGIHFTLTLDGAVKIGPTALPVIGREQYSLIDGFTLKELVQTFRTLGHYVYGDPIATVQNLLHQMSNSNSNQMVREGAKLVRDIPPTQVWKRGKAGIRAQLVDVKKNRFVDDFIVEEKLNVIHILNAVSPGWTSSFPFGRYIAEKFIFPIL